MPGIFAGFTQDAETKNVRNKTDSLNMLPPFGIFREDDQGRAQTEHVKPEI